MIKRHQSYAGADQDGGKEEADELCVCRGQGGKEGEREEGEVSG